MFNELTVSIVDSWRCRTSFSALSLLALSNGVPWILSSSLSCWRDELSVLPLMVYSWKGWLRIQQRSTHFTSLRLTTLGNPARRTKNMYGRTRVFTKIVRLCVVKIFERFRCWLGTKSLPTDFKIWEISKVRRYSHSLKKSGGFSEVWDVYSHWLSKIWNI